MSAMAVALLALLPLALAQAPIEKVVDDMLKGETGAPQASPAPVALPDEPRPEPVANATAGLEKGPGGILMKGLDPGH